MRAVRVHTGEYAGLPDPVEGPAAPWRTAPTAAEAFALLLELVRPGARAGS
jgi:hypothetical protein